MIFHQFPSRAAADDPDIRALAAEHGGEVFVPQLTKGGTGVYKDARLT
jgi:hypothetical protein